MQANELVQQLKSNSAPLVVDARKTVLFKESHIQGALHAKVPWILSGKVRFPDDRNTEMVITCEHGPRSWLARKLLGPQRLSQHLDPRGARAWLEEGRPASGKIEKTPRALAKART